MYTRVCRPLAATLLAVVAVAAAACGGDDASSGGAATSESKDGTAAAPAGEVRKVELMLPSPESIYYIGHLMAVSNGYYKDEGLEVKALPSEGGQFVVQQLAAGKVKYGLAAPEPVLIGASKGVEVRSFAETDRGTILIAAPADSPVNSVADLKGKALGITDAGGGEVGLVKLALEDAGVTDDVKLLPVGAGGPAVFDSLKRERIAAYAGFTPDMAAVEASGFKLKNILSQKFQTLPSDVLLARKDTLEDAQGRETAVKIARAQFKGIEFAMQNREEALQGACKLVPEECQNQKVAEAFLDVTLKAVAPQDGVPKGSHTYAGLETVQEALVKNGQMPKEVDLRSVFSDDLVTETHAK